MKLLVTAGKTMRTLAAAVAKAVTPAKLHRCDPTGFSCDCARRAEIDGRSDGQGSWLGPRRRGGWLR